MEVEWEVQVEVEVEDSQVHKREDSQVHKRDDSQVHKRVPCPRVRTKIRSTWVMSRPSFCTTLPFFTFLVLWRLARTEIRSIQVDSSRPYFRTCVHARPVNVQTHANKRTRPSTCTHTSVHSFAHVHSSVHSFALRSSPRPLATRTAYVHRVSWSYKTIVTRL